MTTRTGGRLGHVDGVRVVDPESLAVETGDRAEYRWGGSSRPGRAPDDAQQRMLLEARRGKRIVVPYVCAIGG